MRALIFLLFNFTFLWTSSQPGTLCETFDSSGTRTLRFINIAEGRRLPIAEGVIVSHTADDIQYAEILPSPDYVSNMSRAYIGEFFARLDNARKPRRVFIDTIFNIAGQYVASPKGFPISASSNVVSWSKSEIFRGETHDVFGGAVQSSRGRGGVLFKTFARGTIKFLNPCSYVGPQLPNFLVADGRQLASLNCCIDEYQDNGGHLQNFLFLFPTAIFFALGTTMVTYGLYCCPPVLGVLMILLAGAPISAAVWCFFFRVIGI